MSKKNEAVKEARNKGGERERELDKLDPIKANLIREHNKAAKIKAQHEYVKKYNENKKQKLIEFKQKTPEEQEIIRNTINLKQEFPYVEKLVLDPIRRLELQKAFNDRKLVVVDPGKRSILYMMGSNNPLPAKKPKMNHYGVKLSKDKDKKFFNYTCHTRKHFLKTREYQDKRKQWRYTGITDSAEIHNFGKTTEPNKRMNVFHKFEEFEQRLTLYSNKSCNLDEFYKYINVKIHLMLHIDRYYDTTLLKKLQWYSYLNKLHHENDLLEQIELEYGSNITIVIGDWSNKGVLKFMPTPNLSLKRKLATKFNVYTIDEFRTSKLHHKYEIICGNLISKSRYSVEKKRLLDKLFKKQKNDKIKTKLMEIKNMNAGQKMLNSMIKKDLYRKLDKNLPAKLKELKVSTITRKNNLKIKPEDEELINKLEEFKKRGLIKQELLDYTKEKALEKVRKVTNYDKGIRSIHSVLTYKIVNKKVNVGSENICYQKWSDFRKNISGKAINEDLNCLYEKIGGCINRDRNSVYNMYKIMVCLLKTRERPERYRRGIKLDEIPNYRRVKNEESASRAVLRKARS